MGVCVGVGVAGTGVDVGVCVGGDVGVGVIVGVTSGVLVGVGVGVTSVLISVPSASLINPLPILPSLVINGVSTSYLERSRNSR